MIVPYDNLASIREKHADSVVAFRGGCYDIVHEGHIAGIEFAKAQADILVVGVRPDKRVRERKGPTRPIRSELSRLAVINAIGQVDYSLLMPDGDEQVSSTLKVLDALRPDVFIAREVEGLYAHPNNPRILAMGIQIVFDPSPPANSTTGIIENILRTHNLEAGRG